MPSQVDIVNAALDEIKARATVTSINPSDGSLAANVAARQYQMRIDALSRAARWNCLRMQQSLVVLKAAAGTPENISGSNPTPPSPWQYEYAVPTNPYFLAARTIVPLLPNTALTPPLTTGGGMILPPYVNGWNVDFRIASDIDGSGNQTRVLLTNMPQAQLVYTARVIDPNMWDSLFTIAAINILADAFCLPVSGDKQLAMGCAQRAKEAIISARVSDGDEGPIKTDHTPDWISARMGGYGGWGLNALPQYDSYIFSDGSAI
jgi:hypothetical protein